MKKTPIICLVLILCLVFACLPARVSAEEGGQAAVSAGCSSLHARIPLDGSAQKLDSAKSVILYELNSDTLVYAWNPDVPINPTGMVKLLTALLVLEKGDLNDVVTVKRSTLDTIAIGAVSAELKAGEQITVRDLLACVMVSSANDAAAVLAVHIAGSQQAFAEMMNARAAELGCTASHFTNAHGLTDGNQYATARDLAIITEAALENPLFSELFSAKTYTVAATNLSGPRKLNTTNYMMSDAYGRKYHDARVTGGKPAAASNTDRSMICTAETGGARYLCVVMSAKSAVSADGLSVTRFGNFAETAALLDYAFAGFHVRQVADDSEALYQYGVSGGENDVVLRPSRDVFAVLPADFRVEDLGYSNLVDADRIKAPIRQGDALGTLLIRYRGIVLGSCDLLAMHAVRESGAAIRPAQRLNREDGGGVSGWRALLVPAAAALGALLVLAVGVLISVRAVRSARIRRWHRRRARDRKRSRS